MIKKIAVMIVGVMTLTLILSSNLYAQGKGKGHGKRETPKNNGRGDNRDDLKSGKIDRFGDGNSGQGDDLHKKGDWKSREETEKWRNWPGKAKEGCGDNNGRGDWKPGDFNKIMEDFMRNMSPEKAEEFMQNMRAHKEEIENTIKQMPPEQREEFTRRWKEGCNKNGDDWKPGEFNKKDDFMRNIPPEKKEEYMKKMQAHREEFENKLREMSPEERKEFMKNTRDEWEKRLGKNDNCGDGHRGDRHNHDEDSDDVHIQPMPYEEGGEITPDDILPPESDGLDNRHGNNGVGNGEDPQPPGNPPVNDGEGSGVGDPGNKGGANSDDGLDDSDNDNGNGGGNNGNGKK